MYINWDPPKLTNGPPPLYKIRRFTPAFNTPPPLTEIGIRFLGNAYYKFPSDTITEDATFSGKRNCHVHQRDGTWIDWQAKRSAKGKRITCTLIPGGGGGHENEGNVFFLLFFFPNGGCFIYISEMNFQPFFNTQTIGHFMLTYWILIYLLSEWTTGVGGVNFVMVMREVQLFHIAKISSQSIRKRHWCWGLQ